MDGTRWERTDGGGEDSLERGQRRRRNGSWDAKSGSGQERHRQKGQGSCEAAEGGPPWEAHLAEEDADLVAVGVTSERHDAPHAGDQLGQVLAAAVHLRLSAGGRGRVSVRLRLGGT